MPGPNSCPNGDISLMLGHVNEEFACVKHGRNGEWCDIDPKCSFVSLRTYLASRGRLVTGKTK